MANNKSNKISTKKPSSPTYVWVSDFVYGGIDGSVTTFAVVAGVHGAQLAPAIVLILGFANLIADGFSMAVGKYSSDKAEQERIAKLRRLATEKISHTSPTDINDLQNILEKQGFTGKSLNIATEVITQNKRVWVEMILHHKHHVADERLYPTKSAWTTFLAFNSVGLIPLLTYVLAPLVSYPTDQLFLLASLMTLVALFIVGAVKSRFTDRVWWISGLGTAFLGGTAAALSYLVGWLLRGLA